MYVADVIMMAKIVPFGIDVCGSLNQNKAILLVFLLLLWYGIKADKREMESLLLNHR